MVKFELLSQNLLIILSELKKNSTFVKYVFYNDDKPLLNPVVQNPSVLSDSGLLLPSPFNTTTTDCTQVRVYYLDIDIEKNVDDCVLIFDVIVAKNLWLINNGKPAVRPYAIAEEIMKTFQGKSIQTIGTLDFQRMKHMWVDEKFDAVRLYARMVNFNGTPS